MSNTLIKSKLQLNNRDAVEFFKVVVFKMGNLNLALRIENVQRVSNETPVYSSGVNNVGIAHVGDRGVTVVDLHRRLFQSSITNQVSQRRYLIIAQNKEGELYGIPVAVVPALIKIALSSIRPIPESYRHANMLGVASHYCHISQDVEESQTIFLLDIEQLLSS